MTEKIYENPLQMKYPRVDSDLLMLAASFKRSPSAPDVFCLLEDKMVRQIQHTHI